MMTENNKKANPPKLAEFILKLFLRGEDAEHRLGDLNEMFEYTRVNQNEKKAVHLYWMQVIKSIPELTKNKFYWDAGMFKNYFKIATRNLLKYKGYSIINITGLSIGIASFLLIFLYVSNELSFDDYHIDNNRIFRVVSKLETSNETRFSALTAAPLGPALDENYSQVEYYARVLTLSSGLVRYGNTAFYEEKRWLADNNLFNILTIPFLRGEKDNALIRPNTVVISERIAKKYFGNENPVNKVLIINNEDYEVTGVVRNCPQNSHLKYEIILSMPSIPERYPMDFWVLPLS